MSVMASEDKPISNEKICGELKDINKTSVSKLLVLSDSEINYSKNAFEINGRTNVEKSKLNLEFLKAELILVEDKKLFMDLWNRPVENVQLNTIDSIERGKLFYAYLIIEGCKRDPFGKCTLSLGFMSLFPNGETDGIGTTSFVLKNANPPIGQFVSPSSTFGVKADGLVGEYTMVARVYDSNADIAFELRKCFQVR
jgi:hypothetical protein